MFQKKMNLWGAVTIGAWAVNDAISSARDAREGKFLFSFLYFVLFLITAWLACHYWVEYKEGKS